MFAAVGLLATAAIYGMTGHRAVWRKLAITVPAFGAIAVVWWTGAVGTRGSAAWWEQPLWRDLLLYAVMLAGMMFRVVWDQLEARHRQYSHAVTRRHRGPRFDFWDFVYPVLPSLVVFQGVLWLAGKNELSLPLCLTSFQNGFFWHALLAKTKEVVESTGAKA